MKKILKVVLLLIGIMVVVVAALLTYVKLALPAANVASAADLKIEYTTERIARGKYLAHYVTMCVDCHSKRDYTMFGAPMVPGTLGQGGELFGKDFGFPGNFYAANITPDGVGNWTDGEL